MWVVKLGGSLLSDALLPAWLDLLVQLGGGRVIIVCGGGAFADEVRRAQTHWRVDDLPAHNMALLAMAQTAYLVQGLNPKLKLAAKLADIRQVLHGGHTALWLPLDVLRHEASADTNWDVTSDSLALELAQQLNAERLVLVKACAIDPAASLSELGEAGIVDRRFARWAGTAALPIDLMQQTELGRMRALMLGDTRAPES